MLSLSDYMENIFEGVSATKYFSDRGNQPSVFNETELPVTKIGKTRIWISFDIDNDPNKVVRKALYNWFNEQQQIESWGNSVATFLVDDYMLDSKVKNYIVAGLQGANVLAKNDWKKTPNISLYVFYRTKKEGRANSGHFVLIQTAKIKQANGFVC